MHVLASPVCREEKYNERYFKGAQMYWHVLNKLGEFSWFHTLMFYTINKPIKNWITEARCGHLSIMDLYLTPASTILYREFTGAGEEKCMLNSASANTIQGIQGACTTSPIFSKIQKCIHTLDKSRQSITGHSNWFIQNRPLPVQSERIPRYELSLSSFIPGGTTHKK